MKSRLVFCLVCVIMLCGCQGKLETKPTSTPVSPSGYIPAGQQFFPEAGERFVVTTQSGTYVIRFDVDGLDVPSECEWATIPPIATLTCPGGEQILVYTHGRVVQAGNYGGHLLPRP